MNTEATEGDIPAEEITISFVCKRYPRKMMKHLQASRVLTVSPFEPGIYYITGDIFPMQLIVTSELSEDNNLWLRNLTNDLKSSDSARKLLRSYEQHRHNRNYKSVMNIIMRANNKLFQGEKGTMCEALLELMHDEIEAILEEKEELAMEKGMKKGMEKGMEKGIEKGMEEGLRKTLPALLDAYKDLGLSLSEIIKSLVTKLNISEDTAMEYVEKYM